MKAAYVVSDRGVPAFGTKGCSLHVQEILRALGALGISTNLFAATLGGKTTPGLAHLTSTQLQRLKTQERSIQEQADTIANVATIAEMRTAAPYDFVYERYSLWSHAGMTYAREAGIPGILEVNAPLIHEQAKYRGLVDAAGAEDISRRCFDAASALIAVSSEVAEYLEGFPEARGKVHVVPNGANIARFANIKHSGKNRAATFTIGFVGTLKPWHGLDELVEAFAVLHKSHTQTRLLIVGDGPCATPIRARVSELGLDGVVEMAGAVDPNEIALYYARMDMGVAPYPAEIDFYFSPLKIFEYMAAGLPVVASDVGQIGEILSNGAVGILYPAGETEQLVKSMEAMVENPEYADNLGATGRDIAAREHSWDKRLEQILDFAGVTQGTKSELDTL